MKLGFYRLRARAARPSPAAACSLCDCNPEVKHCLRCLPKSEGGYESCPRRCWETPR